MGGGCRECRRGAFVPGVERGQEIGLNSYMRKIKGDQDRATDDQDQEPFQADKTTKTHGEEDRQTSQRGQIRKLALFPPSQRGARVAVGIYPGPDDHQQGLPVIFVRVLNDDLR